MRRRGGRLLAMVVALALAAPFARAGTPADFNAGGYRATRYRAPVTRDPAPAARIALAAAMQLLPGRDALFIDVLPAEGGVRDPRTGRWHLAEPHETIAGALWFPGAGRGDPDPALWRGLEREVRAARRHDPALPVILFCRSDCWMSWNAARRLARDGESGVWWLAEGIDGWHAAGGKLVPARPVAVHD